MAMNGTFYGATGNAWIKPRIEWSAQSNLEGNYSDVTATLSYTRTNYGYTTYGHWGGSLTINGDTRYASGVYMEITANGYATAITHTVRVYHGDDGTKSITISAGGGISDTTLTYTSISGQVTLEAIPRASTIGATDADIGSVSMVTVGRRSDRYTHTVAYRFGALSGYLTTDGISSAAVKLTQTSIPFLLPESFYQQIPNASSGVCTLTCTTYQGDTVIGAARQTTFTVRANPEKCGPVLTAQAVDTNSVTVALTGNNAKAVRYASNMRCSMTCQSRFGASIAEKKIADKVLSGDTLTVTGIESGSIRFQVRDSRGYTAQITLTPELVLYYQPTGKLTVTRTDATSGRANLQVQGSWFSGSFGAKKNSLQLRYRVNSGSWQSLSATLDGDHYTASAQLSGLTYTSSHRVDMQVIDSIETLSLTAQVNPGIPVFDWGKSDVQFHVPVSMNGSKITNLAAPTEEADALNLGHAQKAFAPKGYGLGENTGKLIYDIDTAVVPGFYSMGGDSVAAVLPAGYSLFGYGTLLVERRFTYVSQTFRYNGMVAHRYSNDIGATWSPFTKQGMGIEQLWVNASPKSSFAAQTISVDWSKYDRIGVQYDRCYGEMDAKQGAVCDAAWYFANDNGSVVINHRSAEVVSGGVAISGCQVLTTGNYATISDRVIPQKIYGFRGIN